MLLPAITVVDEKTTDRSDKGEDVTKPVQAKTHVGHLLAGGQLVDGRSESGSHYP